MKRKRESSSIGAGSMADVAFLLLVFFLVATTIQTEAGLNMTLPRWVEDNATEERLDADVFVVEIGANNQLLVEEQTTVLEALPALTKQWLETEITSRSKATVVLKQNQESAYATYVAVLDQIKSVYHQEWDQAALARFGQVYERLPKKAQQQIQKDHPFRLVENAIEVPADQVASKND